MRLLPPLLPPLTALACLLSGAAAGDPLWTWQGLRRQREGSGRFFARCGPDQSRILATLQALEQAQDARAVERLSRRVLEAPLDLDARHLLALALRRQGRVVQALQHFHHILALQPAHPSRIHLAAVYAHAGRPELAAAQLAALAEARPESIELRKELLHLYERLGRRRDAVSVCRQMAALAPQDPSVHHALGRALLDARQPRKALEALRTALELEANAATARLDLARALRVLGQREAARKELETLLETSARAAALRELAFLHLRERRFAEASAAFGRALEAAGPEPALLAGALVAAQGAQELDQAVDLAQRLRNQGCPELAATLLANCWLGRSDAAGLDAACQTLPASAQGVAQGLRELFDATTGQADLRREMALQVGLCRAFQQAGWLHEAMAAARSALASVPDQLLLGFTLAECLAASDQQEAATEQLQVLVAHHPRSDAAAFALARASADHGRREAAATLCEQILDRSPDHRGARLLAGRLAMRRGAYDLAVLHARRVLAAAPEDEEALRLAVDGLVAEERFPDAAALVRAMQRRRPAFAPPTDALVVMALGDAQLLQAAALCRTALQWTPDAPRLHRLAAITCLRRKEPAEALPHLQFAALADPHHVQGHVLLARTAGELGRHALAVEALRRALAAADQLDLKLQLAEALSHAGRAEEALALLRSLAPEDAADRRTVEARLAAAYLARGDAARALALAEAVLQQVPGHREAWRVALAAARAQGEVATGARACAQLADSPPLRAELGVLRLLQRRYQDATQLFAQGPAPAAAQAPTSPLVHAVALLAAGQQEEARMMALRAREPGDRPADSALPLAVLLAASGGADAAEPELTRLEGESPQVAAWCRAALPRFAADRELAVAWLVAILARRHGWHAPASAVLEPALERVPNEPVLLHAATVTAREAGKAQAAVRHARELVKATPRSGLAHFLLGQALDAANAGEDALKAYATAAKHLPAEAARPWRLLARRFRDAGREAEAIGAYRRALAAEPDNAALCNNFAWLLARTRPDQLHKAQRLAAKAVELAPENASFHDTLGWVCFLRKDTASARRHFAQALARDPHKASSYAGLGMVCFQEAKHEQARLALRRALALDPQIEDAETFRTTLEMLPPPVAPPREEPER